MTETSPAVVTPLGRKEYRRAGEVLGRAFAGDPLWSVLMPDDDLRARMFDGVVRTIVGARGIVEQAGACRGVALWLRPGRRIGTRAILRSGLAPARWVPRTPREDIKRMTAVLRHVEAWEKLVMPEPHWQLMVLGVDPEHQHGGLASALVRTGLSRADDEGSVSYVDTSAEENVGFYQQFGFEVIEKIMIPDPGVPHWMLVRTPGTTSS